jgi:hypothetical protein
MKTAPWIIIIVLILLLVLQRECHRCPVCPEAITTTDTCYIAGDTVIRELPAVIIPKPDSIIPQPIPTNIDSAAIAKIYFSKVYGYAVLVDDSSMYAGFKYMIEQNRLQWFIPEVANRRATAIIHNTTVIESVKPKNKYFAGIGVGRSFNSFGLAPSVALLTKRDHLYSIHYDILNKDLYATAYWKITWKRDPKTK